MTNQNDVIEGTTISFQDIMELLPHRYPFLMIDALEVIDGEMHGVGIKNVTGNEPWVPGHFPDWPVMPGVLIVEAMAQTAAALVVNNRPGIDNRVIYFMAVDKCRFRNPVVPGNQLRIEVQQITRKGAVWKYKGVARVGDTVAMEAVFTAMNYSPKTSEG